MSAFKLAAWDKGIRPHIGLWLFLATLLVYTFIPTKNFYWDGIFFAQAIEDAHQCSELVHANHLLYSVVGFGVYHILGKTYRALTILQALNAFFAACAVFCLFKTLRHVVKEPTQAAVLTALFAFSGTWWNLVEICYRRERVYTIRAFLDGMCLPYYPF